MYCVVYKTKKAAAGKMLNAPLNLASPFEAKHAHRSCCAHSTSVGGKTWDMVEDTMEREEREERPEKATRAVRGVIIAISSISTHHCHLSQVVKKIYTVAVNERTPDLTLQL